MKKLLMIALLAGTVFCAQAQTKKTPAKMPKAMAAKLNLTADQQPKIDAIYATRATRLDSLVEASGNGDDKNTKRQRRVINTDAETKLLAVLTDDQKKAYADFKEERKEKAKAKVDAAESVAAPKTTPPSK